MKFLRLLKRYTSIPVGNFLKKTMPKTKFTNSIYNEYRNGMISYKKAKCQARIKEEKNLATSIFSGTKSLSKSVGPIPLLSATTAGVLGNFVLMMPCVPWATAGVFAGIAAKQGVIKGANTVVKGLKWLF